MSFSLTIGMVVRLVVIPFVISKFKFHHLALCYRKNMYMEPPNTLGSIFFTEFCKYVKYESGKRWGFLAISQGIVREF